MPYLCILAGLKNKLQQMNNNQLLINQKIREFAQKYYLNQLYKGAIFFVMVTLLTFIIYALLEYFAYFNTTVRAILFYSYLFLFGLTFVFYVVIPILKIMGLGKQISKEKVAAIVGKHFPEIDDKLLNVLQLEYLMEAGNFKSYDLLTAAIDSKIETIKPFPFVKAIPFKNNRRYLKWAAIPILLFIALFSFKSEIFTASTQRIVHHSTFYERPAPYQFKIMNDSLQAFQNETFDLQVKIVGKETPEELFITIKEKKYKLIKVSNTEFTYKFTNIQRSTTFQLVAEELTSKPYKLKVLPKPVTISFVMQLEFPAYLNKNKETIENNGDAMVPEGTKITWLFYTKNTDNLHFISENSIKKIRSEDDIYRVSALARAPFDYAIVNSNRYYSNKDTLKHSISVIPDQYPEIYVDSKEDSLFADRIYFKGNIKDDYGFSNLKFVYSKFNSEGNLLENGKIIPIEIQSRNTIQDFYFYFDAGTLDLDPGYYIEYHFEVRDNDGVNGSKMSKTTSNTFRLKTMEEIDHDLSKGNSETKDDFEKLLQESKQISQDFEKLTQQLLQKQTPSWQDKQKMESLMNQFNELQKQIDALQEKQQEQRSIEEQFKNLSPELIKKQEELQKRFDEILSDEMKQLFQKMQKMMNEINKDKMKEAAEQMKLNSEEINKGLDEQLQLFKQLEFEKKYNDLIDKTRNLAEEQKQLSENSKSKNTPKDELLKKQNEIEQKYNQLKQDYKELQQLNKELEEPNNMKDHSELQQQIEEDMKGGNEALQKNNRGKASEKQQSAGEKMEELSYQMEQDMLESEAEDLEEDIQVLRQILDNLVKISFEQERNMEMARKMSAKSPNLSEVVRGQFMIQEHMRVIRDSLNALARRQTAIKPFIQKEVDKIDNYLEQAKTNLNERRIPQASSNQQFGLTSMNNLALMLAESLKEVKEKQQQNQSQCSKCKKRGKSSSSCSNPGGSKKSKAKSARELQQQLNRQMEALQRSLQQGEGKPTGVMPGNTQSLNEQFARMAAQQEAIRKMLQDLQNELKSQNGVGDKSLEQMLQEMQKTEKELVNKILNQQTINRQKNIETRLLESERAEMQREKEEKRESKEGKELRNPNPPKEWNFDKTKQQQTEMLKTVPPTLNYYYKEKVNQYFYNIE